MTYILPVAGSGPNKSVNVADHEAAVNLELTAIKTAAVAAASDPEVAEAMVAQVETLFGSVVDQVNDLTDAAVAATGADRVQTGLDVVAADAGATRAEAALDAATLISAAQKAFRQPLIFDAILQGLIGDDAVAVGQTYTATGNDVDFIGLYRRTGDAAVEVAQLPSASAVGAVQQAPSLGAVQPNLISVRADRIESIADFATLGTSTLVAATVNGLPVWRLTVPGSNAALYRVPRALITGSVVSASVLIVAMSAAGAGASSTASRVLLRQLNTGGTEISGTRQTYDLVSPTSAALPAPVRVRFGGVALHADCDRVELWIEASNTGGATSRTIDFREMHISAGPSATYRVPGEAFAVDANTEIRSRADWDWSRNIWPDSELRQAAAVAIWGTNVLAIEEINGRRAIRTPSSGTAISVIAPPVDVSDFASGKASVSIVIEDKPVTAAGALRVRLAAKDASGTTLTWADQTGTDNPTETMAYTRNVPEAAIAAPTSLIVARDIALPVGTATLILDMRVETTEQMLFNKICIREGGNPAYYPSSDMLENSVTQMVDDYLPNAFLAENTSNRRVAIATVSGQKRHRITYDPSSSALVYMQIPRGNILGLDGGKVSFSAVVSATAGNGTTGNSRVLLLFRNGSSELAAFRQTASFNTNGGAVSERTVSFRDVTIPTDPWDNIRVIFDAQPGNGTIARTMDVSNVLLTGGAFPSYRPCGAGSLGRIPEALGFTILPDVPGGAPTGGGTCTGLDKVSSGPFKGCLIVGIDGRAVEGDGSPFAARAIIISPDFVRLLASYDLVSPSSDGVQGIAWDTSDGTFWAARPGLKRIEHYTGAGVEISGDRINLTGWAGAWDTPNGLAYDAANNALYVCSASSATVYRIPKAATISATLTIGSATPDQLCLYDGKLYVSVGANGANGEVHAHDLTTGVNSVPFVELPFAQAIEGIFLDGKTLHVVNDGGFHTVASPALNIGISYDLTR